MDNKTLEILIKNEVAKVFDKYNQLLPYNKLNFDDFELNFKLKGRVAGKAWYIGRRLSFNLFYAKDNLLSFLSDTIPHEVAHLYQMYLYPNSKPHGKEWKNIMDMGGYNPVRCHSYDSASLPEKNKKDREIFEYSCKCRVHKLSKIKHNKFMRGENYYTCRYCHERLQFVKKWVIPQEEI